VQFNKGEHMCKNKKNQREREKKEIGLYYELPHLPHNNDSKKGRKPNFFSHNEREDIKNFLRINDIGDRVVVIGLRSRRPLLPFVYYRIRVDQRRRHLSFVRSPVPSFFVSSPRDLGQDLRSRNINQGSLLAQCTP
jgi:hypothetical protein